MNDIDFNEGNYYNITSPIYIKCEELDGQGYKLDNLLVTNTKRLFQIAEKTQTTNIKNVVFEILGLDVYNGYTLFYFDDSNDTGVSFIFTNCDFRIKIKQYGYYVSCFNTKDKIGITFNNCIFNIDIILYCSADLFIFETNRQSNYFYNCMINIDLYKNVKTEKNNRVLFRNWDSDTKQYINFCGIFINLHNNIINDNLNGRATFNILYDFNNHCYCYFNSSYIIAQNKGSYKSHVRLSERDAIIFKNKCFYDDTLANGLFINGYSYVDASSFPNLLPLTTEQCKDAAYLESVGFIIST